MIYDTDWRPICGEIYRIQGYNSYGSNVPMVQRRANCEVYPNESYKFETVKICVHIHLLMAFKVSLKCYFYSSILGFRKQVNSLTIFLALIVFCPTLRAYIHSYCTILLTEWSDTKQHYLSDRYTKILTPLYHFWGSGESLPCLWQPSIFCTLFLVWTFSHILKYRFHTEASTPI